MGFRVGDRVEVSYPDDDFPGHVGIVEGIIDSEDKIIEKVYWPLNGCGGRRSN